MAALPTPPADAQRKALREKPKFLQRAAQQWQDLAPREKTFVGVALCVVAAALLWWQALAPSLNVLKTAPTQRIALDAQLLQMQNLAAQAKGFQALPKIKSNDAARALEALVKQRLGATAQLSLVGNQATLSLTNARADALAQFLGQARAQANALPSQARLRRSNSLEAWDGTLVLQLPAQ